MSMERTARSASCTSAGLTGNSFARSRRVKSMTLWARSDLSALMNPPTHPIFLGASPPAPLLGGHAVADYAATAAEPTHLTLELRKDARWLPPWKGKGANFTEAC